MKSIHIRTGFCKALFLNRHLLSFSINLQHLAVLGPIIRTLLLLVMASIEFHYMLEKANTGVDAINLEFSLSLSQILSKMQQQTATVAGVCYRQTAL